MTTPVAAALYAAEHMAANSGRKTAVFNPNGLAEADLPVIYGFNNGGSIGWLEAVLLAQDGTHLGGHCCSDECYMPADLGILDGTRDDRHEGFRKHYPGGYRMEFVRGSDVRGHEKLNAAYALNVQKREQAQAEPAP